MKGIRSSTGLWAVGLLLGVWLVAAGLTGEAGLLRWLELRRELGDARSRIAALRADVTGLRAEIAGLTSDDDFALERAIREQMELAEPGQTVLRLRGADDSNARIP